MEFYEAVIAIQNELKAPKSRFNSFGKYNYRSCEDILEAVKPLCAKYGLVLTVSDDLIVVGDRFYVRARAKIRNAEGESLCAFGYAREDEDKKGMDGAQVTGTSSSYARKYALNGLLLIDDTKDADTDEHTKEAKARSEKAKAEPKPSTKIAEPDDVQKQALKDACNELGINLADVLSQAGFKKGMVFDMELYSKALVVLKEIKESRVES